MSEDEYDLGDFDAESLAVVAEVEQKFQENVTLENVVPQGAIPSRPATTLPTRPTQERFIRPPPAKRVRTNEWNTFSLPNRSESDEDMLDFAVVAAQDGKYRVLNAENGISKTNSFTNSSSVQHTASNHQLQHAHESSKPTSSRGVPQASSNTLRRAPSVSNTWRNSSVIPTNSQYPINPSQSRIAAITAALQESDEPVGDDEVAKLRAQILEVIFFPIKYSLFTI